MTTIALKKAQTELADTIKRVQETGERIALEQDGREVAALVSIEDLRFLEELEERQDLDAYRAALAEAEREGTVPLEKILEEYGIRD